MQRIFNPGTTQSPALVRAVCEYGGKEVKAVRVPDPFCERGGDGKVVPKYVAHEEGSAYLNLGPQGGFFHVRKGGSMDVPTGITVQAILNAGPHHFEGDGQSAREVATLMVEGSPEHEQWLEREEAKKTAAPVAAPSATQSAPAPKAKA